MTNRVGTNRWRRSFWVGLFIVSMMLWSAGAVAFSQNDHISIERRTMRVEDRESNMYRPSGAWKTLLQFTAPATYEYELWRQGNNRAAMGSIIIQVAPTYVAFSYELNGQKDGLLLRSNSVSPGEALIADLLTSERWSDEDIRLLWTPFIITRWATEFNQIQWRTGPAWSVRSGGTEQFTIDQVLRDARNHTIYRGRLVQNGAVVLYTDINLDLPLPEYVLWIDRSGTRYEAELKWERAPRVIPSLVGN